MSAYMHCCGEVRPDVVVSREDQRPHRHLNRGKRRPRGRTARRRAGTRRVPWRAPPRRHAHTLTCGPRAHRAPILHVVRCLLANLHGPRPMTTVQIVGHTDAGQRRRGDPGGGGCAAARRQQACLPTARRTLRTRPGSGTWRCGPVEPPRGTGRPAAGSTRRRRHTGRAVQPGTRTSPSPLCTLTRVSPTRGDRAARPARLPRRRGSAPRRTGPLRWPRGGAAPGASPSQLFAVGPQLLDTLAGP